MCIILFYVFNYVCNTYNILKFKLSDNLLKIKNKKIEKIKIHKRYLIFKNIIV